MTLAIIFAHLWGVLELTVLGSLSRTIRLLTIVLALIAGMYVCGPLALLLQFTWIKLYVALTGASASEMLSFAGYTIDPFIEEIAKVVPLLVILRLGAARSRWTLTDCILIGAACGAGFGLAEDLFRYSAVAHRALADAQGWPLRPTSRFPM